MRARLPHVTGSCTRHGVRIAYDVYGSGPATLLILPTWSVLDAAHGRFQLIDLSRHYRVVTFDPRGNGRSDRPHGREAYAGEEFVQDALAVLDATGTDRAVVLACSICLGMLLGACGCPERRGRLRAVLGCQTPTLESYEVADELEHPPISWAFRSSGGDDPRTEAHNGRHSPQD